MRGWLRSDGRKGIRNTIVIVYMVECAHHVAREIVLPFREFDVQLIGFSGCYPNLYAYDVMRRLCTHPNVGAVLLVSLGCEGFNSHGVLDEVEKTGRPVSLLVIQESGGTRQTIETGQKWVELVRSKIDLLDTVSIGLDDLVVGTICGGSDGSSGATANPAVGRAFDQLVDNGAACIFEETGELIGSEHHMATRAATPELGDEIVRCVEKAARYYEILGHGSFAPGNADGGLTTQEEKSMGAYCKSGKSKIAGLLKPGDIPPQGGLYLLDVVPDGEVRFGFPNIADSAEIVELISCGCLIILFTTGRGSVVGSAISPVIKICTNDETFCKLEEDMDINAGVILSKNVSLDTVGDEIRALVQAVGEGTRTKSESLGHQEFILTYKTFEPIGPSCLPSR